MYVFINFWKLETENSLLHVFSFLHKLNFENSFCFLPILSCQTNFLILKIENCFWKQKIRGKNSYQTYPYVGTRCIHYTSIVKSQTSYPPNKVSFHKSKWLKIYKTYKRTRNIHTQNKKKMKKTNNKRKLRLCWVTIFIFYFQKLVFGNINKKQFSCIF